jgi:deoxyribonuclease V
MNFCEPLIRHAWDLDEADAIHLQEHLAGKVVAYDHLKVVRYIAGVDAAYDEKRRQQFAAAVVLDAENDFRMVESATAREPLRTAYTPGLFSFRELPTIIQALRKLKSIPDLIVVDGHGVAHPRRFGLACHLGVMFDVPTIGCGKRRLTGTADDPGPHRGAYALLMDRGETIGRVLRTQARVKPLVVSVGHRVSLTTAGDWILRLTVRYRMPETTRRADQMVRRLKKAFAGGGSRGGAAMDPPIEV